MLIAKTKLACVTSGKGIQYKQVNKREPTEKDQKKQKREWWEGDENKYYKAHRRKL
jgi:hypothetical protein